MCTVHAVKRNAFWDRGMGRYITTAAQQQIPSWGCGSDILFSPLPTSQGGKSWFSLDVIAHVLGIKMEDQHGCYMEDVSTGNS